MHSLRERCKLLVEGKSATRAERGPVQLTRRVLDAKVFGSLAKAKFAKARACPLWREGEEKFLLCISYNS
jgi:hypothetical protein